MSDQSIIQDAGKSLKPMRDVTPELVTTAGEGNFTAKSRAGYRTRDSR